MLAFIKHHYSRIQSLSEPVDTFDQSWLN